MTVLNGRKRGTRQPRATASWALGSGLAIVLLAAAICFPPQPSAAQAQQSYPAQAPQPYPAQAPQSYPAQAPQSYPARAPQRDPQIDIFVMLVRNAVTAANQGNLTGNYTVLRDLGGPAFRQRNSAAQLAVIFQRLRDQKVDLSPILIHAPVFTERPGIDQAGELQLVGFFPTEPLQIRFRLAFQRVQGGWMIDAVGIGTAPASARARRPRPSAHQRPPPPTWRASLPKPTRASTQQRRTTATERCRAAGFSPLSPPGTRRAGRVRWQGRRLPASGPTGRRRWAWGRGRRKGRRRGHHGFAGRPASGARRGGLRRIPVEHLENKHRQDQQQHGDQVDPQDEQRDGDGAGGLDARHGFESPR